MGLSDEEIEENIRTEEAIAKAPLKNGRINYSEIYPEFYLREPYGVWNQVAPVHAFLPFYQTTIVLVEPFPDHTSFEKYYGLSLKDLITLRREQRVVTLVGNYREYPTWYGDLFKIEHVPSWGRIEIVMRQLFSDGTDHLSKIESLFAKVTPDQVDDRLIDFMSPLFRTFPGDAKQNFIGLEKSRAIRLSVMGYGKLLDSQATVENPNVFLFYVYLLDSMISWPAHFSLGGYTNYSSWWYLFGRDVLQDLQIQASDKNIVASNAYILAQLSTRLHYGHPINYPPLEFAKKIESISEISENHKILVDVQRLLEECKIQDGFDRSQEAIELMKCLDQQIEKISKGYKIAKYSLQPAFTVLTSSTANALLSQIQVPACISFPLGFLGGLASLAIDDLRQRLDDLAKLLVGARYGKDSAAFLIWKRESKQ